MPSAAKGLAARAMSLASSCSVRTPFAVFASPLSPRLPARYSRLNASSQSGAAGKLSNVALTGCQAHITAKDPKRSRLPSQDTRTGSPSGGASAMATITLARTYAAPGQMPCACATMTRFAALMLKNRPSKATTAFWDGHTSARINRRKPLISSRRSTARAYVIPR